ncbi:MAG: hypothetical protein L6R40_005237 [Gallowayella cf. fulva]|nr:MAG: hypothetical protein L6R40_005237 [Xanthomendoza cf. fulva]
MTTNSLSIDLHEPSLTADNLGHKTWLASYLLAQRLSYLTSCLPCLDTGHGARVIELGAGTGLVGIAVAAIFNVHVHLTDLPAILPNLQTNVKTNAKSFTKGNVSVGEFDWSSLPSGDNTHRHNYDLVVAADPLYSPLHPAWLVAAIDYVLKRHVMARVLIELPMREAYAPQINELKSRMEALGLEIQLEDVENGLEDWEGAHRGTGRTEVECWWAVWRWGPISLLPY